MPFNRYKKRKVEKKIMSVKDIRMKRIELTKRPDSKYNTRFDLTEMPITDSDGKPNGKVGWSLGGMAYGKRVNFPPLTNREIEEFADGLLKYLGVKGLLE